MFSHGKTLICGTLVKESIFHLQGFVTRRRVLSQKISKNSSFRIFFVKTLRRSMFHLEDYLLEYFLHMRIPRLGELFFGKFLLGKFFAGKLLRRIPFGSENSIDRSQGGIFGGAFFAQKGP
jgi:hypothetical protein